ncbi:MAG: hypothetical protein MOB07_07545 [Acidobacteria bacterium]|nr:hypothetical protein [Acidobacteriota bacterium]
MYFFYFDESGSRDPSIGTAAKPKDHLYVLLAVGMFERQWFPFDRSIANLKLELADYLRRDGKGRFELAGLRGEIKLGEEPIRARQEKPFPECAERVRPDAPYGMLLRSGAGAQDDHHGYSD